MPVNVVQEVPLTVALPTQVKLGFTTKRTSALPGVSSLTCIVNVCSTPGVSRPVGLWMPSKSFARLPTRSALSPSTSTTLSDGPPLWVQGLHVPLSKSSDVTTVSSAAAARGAAALGIIRPIARISTTSFPPVVTLALPPSSQVGRGARPIMAYPRSLVNRYR